MRSGVRRTPRRWCQRRGDLENRDKGTPPGRVAPGTTESLRVATPGAGGDGANREFRKIIAQGGHVTPSIESNPLTACTRN